MGGSDPIANEARRRAAVNIDPNTNRGPVTGVRGGEPVGFDDNGNKVGGGVTSGGKGTYTGPPASTSESEQDKIDREIRDFVRSRIGAANNVDTTEAEALITRQMEGKLGEGLVDARARGGRAGFGMSGAQMAVEGDVRGAASRSALDQILGLRRGEEQRAIENATSAISTEQGMRSAASADALRRMVLESLQAEAGLGGDENADSGIGFDAAGENDLVDAVGAGESRDDFFGNVNDFIGNALGNPGAEEVSSPPKGAKKVPGRPGIWFVEATGKYYKVK